MTEQYYSEGVSKDELFLSLTPRVIFPGQLRLNYSKRQALLLLHNFNKKRHCFPRSPSLAHSGTTGRTVETLFYSFNHSKIRVASSNWDSYGRFWLWTIDGKRSTNNNTQGNTTGEKMLSFLTHCMSARVTEMFSNCVMAIRDCPGSGHSP